MRCEFGVFENGQSDNVGDNKTPSDADVADAREAISGLDSTQIISDHGHDLEEQVAANRRQVRHSPSHQLLTVKGNYQKSL
jgi:hypothetical protein